MTNTKTNFKNSDIKFGLYQATPKTLKLAYKNLNLGDPKDLSYKNLLEVLMDYFITNNSYEWTTYISALTPEVNKTEAVYMDNQNKIFQNPSSLKGLIEIPYIFNKEKYTEAEINEFLYFRGDLNFGVIYENKENVYVANMKSNFNQEEK